MKYALQSYQPYPESHIKQLRPNELRKNMTNLPMRWKEIAFSDDLEELKLYLTSEKYRIIDWSNLEVVARYNPYVKK